MMRAVIPRRNSPDWILMLRWRALQSGTSGPFMGVVSSKWTDLGFKVRTTRTILSDSWAQTTKNTELESRVERKCSQGIWAARIQTFSWRKPSLGRDADGALRYQNSWTTTPRSSTRITSSCWTRTLIQTFCRSYLQAFNHNSKILGNNWNLFMAQTHTSEASKSPVRLSGKPHRRKAVFHRSAEDSRLTGHLAIRTTLLDK